MDPVNHINHPIAQPGAPAAGAVGNFQPNLGIINLDAYEHLDPSTALLKIVADRAQCPIDQLQNFQLESKGFRGDVDKDQPIPVYAYSNPPGPECYCFIRHWTVKYEDPGGAEHTLQFTKKIFTNVEIPRNYSGAEHKQQQYIAGMAARTYAKIEESRIIFGATGVPNAVYTAIQPHISKIARDRFVRMEFFQGAEQISVNSSKVQDRLISSVRLNIRSGSKTNNAGLPADSPNRENESEAYPVFKLTDEVANAHLSKEQELKGKKYQLMKDDTSSVFVTKLSTALRKTDIIHALHADPGLNPVEAFRNAGVEPAIMHALQQGQIHDLANKFYGNLECFRDKKAVNSSLMAHYGKGGEISKSFLNAVAPDTGFKLKDIWKKPEAVDLDLLNKIHAKYSLNTENISEAEKVELDKIIKAYSAAYEELKKIDDELFHLESDLKTMGFEIDEAEQAKRIALLTNIYNIITTPGLAPPAALHDPHGPPTDLPPPLPPADPGLVHIPQILVE